MGISSLVNEGRNEMFYLIAYDFTYGYVASDIMVKDHSDSEEGNILLSLHGLLFPISSKGSFICNIPQTGWHQSRRTGRSVK